MNANRFQLHPYTRLVVVFLGLVAAFLAKDLRTLVVFEVLLVPVIYISGSTKLLGTFILVVGLPMSLLFSLEYYWSRHRDFEVLFGQLTLVSRLIVYTTILQLLLILPLKYVAITFSKWGFKGGNLLTVTSSYFVWADIVSRSERILLARLGCGYVEKRTILSRLAQIPFIILPLVIGIMRTATVRSDSWEQKKFMERIETIRFQQVPVNRFYNITLIILIALWLFIILFINNH